MDQPNVVLPKELRLGAPATMPQSRSYMFKQQAALNNYNPRDTIQINLPRLQRSYLTKDSYLEFEVEFKYTTGTTAAEKVWHALMLDTPGALGLIDRIEVYDYLGSTQLESTSGFGQLIALLQDTCITQDEYGTHWEATSGGQTPAIVNDFERGTIQPVLEATVANSRFNFDRSIMRMQQPVHGEIIDNTQWWTSENGSVTIDTTANTRTMRRRYHIPLFSFLGLLSPKYAPLHNGYTIMITLQTAENALISANMKYDWPAAATAGSEVTTATAIFGSAPSFQIKTARMCCQILELGPIAESMLLSTTGNQPMIVTTKAYRNYNNAIPAGSANFKLDLNINVASLTNVLWIMRPTAFLNSTKFPSLSHRQRNFLESWYFQYGSSILPQTQGITAFKPISNNASHPDNGSECLIELLKARHLYNQPQKTHLFNKYNYAYDNWADYMKTVGLAQEAAKVPDLAPCFKYVTPNTYYEHGKFACGLDLELVSGRTNEIICGMNTNGMNTAIFATFNATAAANGTPAAAITADPPTVTLADLKNSVVKSEYVEGVTMDAWCEYDAFINISPGIATTVSF